MAGRLRSNGLHAEGQFIVVMLTQRLRVDRQMLGDAVLPDRVTGQPDHLRAALR